MKISLAVHPKCGQFAPAMRTAPKKDNQPTPLRGRPPGRHKSAKNLSIDKKLAAKFTVIAFNEGVSFSGYVERLMREKAVELGIKI